MIAGIRAPYWAVTVWVWVILQTVATPFFFGQGFDYAVWIATPIVTLGALCTGGYGIAKGIQDWVDTRRFRQQLEKVEVDH
jgi:hypothetical protein